MRPCEDWGILRNLLAGFFLLSHKWSAHTSSAVHHRLHRRSLLTQIASLLLHANEICDPLDLLYPLLVIASSNPSVSCLVSLSLGLMAQPPNSPWEKKNSGLFGGVAPRPNRLPLFLFDIVPHHRQSVGATGASLIGNRASAQFSTSPPKRPPPVPSGGPPVAAPSTPPYLFPIITPVLDLRNAPVHFSWTSILRSSHLDLTLRHLLLHFCLRFPIQVGPHHHSHPFVSSSKPLLLIHSPRLFK